MLEGANIINRSRQAEIGDLRRREFLIRFCQAAGAALIPSGLFGSAFPGQRTFPSSDAPTGETEYHLHPHYRSPRPLDTTLLKVQTGLDAFISERYADQIGATLAEWSVNLRLSPPDLHAIAKSFAPGFQGGPPQPKELRSLRSGLGVQAHQGKFDNKATLGRDAFLRELQAALNKFSKIFTADFQITKIDAANGPKVQTRVRYEIVGAGDGFHREQRVGNWEMMWEQSRSGESPSSEFILQAWHTLDETRARSASPVYADITASALGGNSSYAAQLLHGNDHWRTILDGACGIDIYGHNGVSIADIDSDGYDDLYICQPAGLPNRLYRNRGDGTFEDITESSGLGLLENTACALFADFENDGRQDVIVVRASGPLLFSNEGGGKFRSKPAAFHFASPPQGTFTGAAVADYDRDGWLDIYFCLYSYYQGADQYKYPSPYHDAENGPPNFMMRNNRDGSFRDVTTESGLTQNNTRYSFCCAWSDFDHDGWPDLCVANDFGRKNLYRNNGDGTFTDIAAEVGVEDIGAGMGVCWFDYDNDGAEDLYVANMWTAAGERISMQGEFRKDSAPEIRKLYHRHAMGNSLFHNSMLSAAAPGPKPRPFENRTIAAGVGIGRWAWATDSWDFDHDGFADLYVTNGMVSGPSRTDLNSFFWRQAVALSPDEARPSHDYEQGWGAINELIRADGTWSGYERNIFYANNGDGTFSDVSGAVGLDFLEDGRAFALADFDLDGRQEVFIKNRNGPQLRLLKNVVLDLPPSIAFRLTGKKSNRDAIGAVIRIKTEQGLQTRSLQAGSGFISQHSKEIFFGLGAAKGPLTASIHWPSGLVQELNDLPINHRIWVEEGAAPTRLEPFPTPAEPAKFDQLLPQPTETLPATAATWLLAPLTAPDFSLPDSRTGKRQSLTALRGTIVLLHFGGVGEERTQKDWAVFNQHHANWSVRGLQLVSIAFAEPAAEKSSAARPNFSFPVLSGSDDVGGIYSILVHYMFDRRRELGLPTSFLIDAKGEIVKVYQGPIDPVQVERDFRNIPQTAAMRLSHALPFAGVAAGTSFSRNYLSYGTVYFQRGYLDQAGVAYEIASHDDPESAEALYGVGSVYLNQQKLVEARRCFERALKLHAAYPDTMAHAWNNLGLLAGREGRTADAIGYFQEALRLNPEHRVALQNLAQAYRMSKRWDEARKTYERLLQLSPDDPEANYGLGMVFAQNDDTARAEESFQRALEARPVYPEVLNNLGILLLRTDRVDQAIATFRESIRVAPAFDQAYLNLARVYTVEEVPKEARAVLQELLKQHPDHEQAREMLQKLQ